MSIQYEIILYRSQEDQAFIAEVPELPGRAADGATYQEALANAEVLHAEEAIRYPRSCGCFLIPRLRRDGKTDCQLSR